MKLRIKNYDIPISVYILAFGIFAMVTSEFQVAGMLPAMSQDLGVTISQIGYLVSIYSFSQAVGGIILSIILLKINLKNALLILLLAFIIGQSLGALSNFYTSLVVARIITGAACGAFWSISLTKTVELVSPELSGKALAIVLTGTSVGMIIGLPSASVIGDALGWQAHFWTVAVLAVIAALLSLYFIPHVEKNSHDSLSSQFAAFKNAKLWLVYLTSMLVNGASFAGFTFFKPILQNITGFSSYSISSLLFVYGVATIIGTNIVGRFAIKYTIRVISIGLFALIIFFSLLAVFATSAIVAVIAVTGVGLFGVTMNTALVTRVVKTGGNLLLVNTVHTFVITFGIMLGSFLAGLSIAIGFGLTSAIWMSIILAILALLSLVPELWLRAEKS